MNAFFSGVDAVSIAIADEVAISGSRIAVSRTVEQNDNDNAFRMGRIGDTALTALGGLTPKAFYRDLATGIGSDISTRKIMEENTHGIWRNLTKQRDEISGVDMNDEAARMMVFERLFQAMARYMNTVSESISTVMTLIR